MLIYSLISFQVHICSVHSHNSDTHSATQQQWRLINWHALGKSRLQGQKHVVVSTANLLLACNAIYDAMQLLAAAIVTLHLRVPQTPMSMLAMHADSIFKPSTLTRATMGAVYCMHTEPCKSATA